ncbi:hypothetical protein F4780DRAFT_13898 [Xylariomycetidae sp. FL0641]|nr:hypothetical protein F4780DRAFT_13898 [Xylariomycetidae sp. FL0641]
MADDTFESELASLQSSDLREVIRRICGTHNVNLAGHLHDVAFQARREIRRSRPPGPHGHGAVPTPGLTPDRGTTPASSQRTAVEQGNGSVEDTRPPPMPSLQLPSHGDHRVRDFNPQTMLDLSAIPGLQAVQRCDKCAGWYTESHNTLISCAYHPGRVYFRDADFLAYVPALIAWDHRYVPSAFVWTCCYQQVGDTNGCVNGRHEPAAPGYPGPGTRMRMDHRHPATVRPFRSESASTWI